MRWREVERKLTDLGAQPKGKPRGSHHFWEVTGEVPGSRTEPVAIVVVRTTVPHHGGDIPLGTLKGIERDMATLFGPRWLTG